ncbi:MATE efflux family protein DTX1 [Pyrus ussuriensis x Pyrus communis]|uniref:Protein DETOXIFICATION n=1 Tax=Pyrus ussuriensis x Pyrus communis TaxID=2448454 RepID=A0A5N5H6D1_9ROSA|nr:MATE efflux family protein DTX1 [Pyrus ussuriensis x Pyrus communis]
MSATTISHFEEKPTEKASQKWPGNFFKVMLLELKIQRGIALPLIAITTAFLGKLGELQLAGGTLGFTFANVTGFSVLNGLCAAMEPICGQAFGAKNIKLLHKTLLMVTFLLLLVTLPISFLWHNVDKILIHFGQQEDISLVAKTYLFYLLPDLVVTSLLCPIKAYWNSQGITVPSMFCLGLALAFYVPVNILLVKAKGLEGVAMSVWIIDLMVMILLAVYVRWNEGGWLDQRVSDWKRLLKLCGPCCLTTCLEWWCYEILMSLAIVLNFDYLLYSVMLSLATFASTCVCNELGANRAGPAYQSAFMSVVVSVVSGFLGGLVMLAARGRGVKKMMPLMALVEEANFPLAMCGGIVRGTARPWLVLYANLGGFYLLALPLGVVLSFKVSLGLRVLLGGFLIGMVACLILLIIFVLRINWKKKLARHKHLPRLVVKHQNLTEMEITKLWRGLMMLKSKK